MPPREGEGEEGLGVESKGQQMRGDGGEMAVLRGLSVGR